MALLIAILAVAFAIVVNVGVAVLLWVEYLDAGTIVAAYAGKVGMGSETSLLLSSSTLMRHELDVPLFGLAVWANSMSMEAVGHYHRAHPLRILDILSSVAVLAASATIGVKTLMMLYDKGTFAHAMFLLTPGTFMLWIVRDIVHMLFGASRSTKVGLRVLLGIAEDVGSRLDELKTLGTRRAEITTKIDLERR